MSQTEWDKLSATDQKKIMDGFKSHTPFGVVELPQGVTPDTFYYQGVPIRMEPTLDLDAPKIPEPPAYSFAGSNGGVFSMTLGGLSFSVSGATKLDLEPATKEETPAMFTLSDNTIQEFLNIKQIAKDFPEEIKTGGVFNTVDQCRTAAKKLAALVETAREEAKAPFIAQGKMVDDAAKLFTKPLNELIARCDKLRTAYRDSSTRAQRGPVILDQATDGTLSVPDLSGFAGAVTDAPPVLKSRTQNVVEITEERLIPEEYYVLDMVKLRADLLAGKIVAGAKLIQKKILL